MREARERDEWLSARTVTGRGGVVCDLVMVAVPLVKAGQGLARARSWLGQGLGGNGLSQSNVD
ncbi:hypothetical protein E2C01_091777 [Portunus trituberculatus]|uniref:Uncharacterized protein n=1 Tax=Portunus trituberculatus TaxID=210409 RepID=A0A5B7JVZ5_PORTR|nr:hypothetical protein [Portunus trituberculatus]